NKGPEINRPWHKIACCANLSSKGTSTKRGVPTRERNVLTPGFSSALTCSQPTMQRGGRAFGCLRNLRWPKATRDKKKENNIMKIIQKIGILSVAFCLMAGFAHAAGKSERPDATLQLSSGAVAAGVGITWGKGTLTYKG